MSEQQNTDFENADLTGARFHKTRLVGARFRMVDLAGVSMRDVSLAGAEIYGSELDGLIIDGIEIAPLVEAELARRYPARPLRRAGSVADLRRAWSELERGWARAYAQAATLPTGSVDVCVDGEWSFAQTLRHLVFATDTWLGAARGSADFHSWGVPFTEYAEFVDDPDSLGLDLDANPDYEDVLAVRAARVTQVRDYLARASDDELAGECRGPDWAGTVTKLSCMQVIVTEECEHLRFAERDLARVAAGTA